MAGPDTKQLDILKALTTHIEGVTPGNGYDFDLTSAVFRGRAIFGDDDVLPMVAILEALRPEDIQEISVAGEQSVMRSEKWLLLVQGFVNKDELHPTDTAYQLMGAVQHRLGRLIATRQDSGDPTYPDEYLLGRKITSLAVGPGAVSGPRPEIATSHSFFYLPLAVGMVVDQTNPFVT